MYIEIPFSDCISRLIYMWSVDWCNQKTVSSVDWCNQKTVSSVDWCNQKTVSLYTYQSTYAIRKRHIIAVLHISKPWIWGKNEKKGGYGVKRGDAVSCPQAPVVKWPFSWDSQVSPHCLSFIIWFSHYRFSLYVL